MVLVGSCPAIGEDGTIYMGTQIHNEVSPWPKYRCNNKNTGCIASK